MRRRHVHRTLAVSAAALALTACSSTGSGPARSTGPSPWDREKLKALLPTAGERIPGTQWAVDSAGPFTEAKSLGANPSGPATIVTTCAFWGTAEPGNLFGLGESVWASEHLISPTTPEAEPITVWVIAAEPGISVQEMAEARRLATSCAAQDRHLKIGKPAVAGTDETLDVRSETADMLAARVGDVTIVLSSKTGPGAPNLLDPSVLPALEQAVTDHTHAAGLPQAAQK